MAEVTFDPVSFHSVFYGEVRAIFVKYFINHIVAAAALVLGASLNDGGAGVVGGESLILV